MRKRKLTLKPRAPYNKFTQLNFCVYSKEDIKALKKYIRSIKFYSMRTLRQQAHAMKTEDVVKLIVENEISKQIKNLQNSMKKESRSTKTN